MATKLSCHWQYMHPSQEDDRYLGAWRPLHIKIVYNSDVEIPGLDTALKYINPAGRVLVRNHYIVSENSGVRKLATAEYARWCAITHATYYKRIWDKENAKRALDPKKFLFCGLNEPQVWAEEPPNLVAIYYEEFVKQIHALLPPGVGVCTMAFGVGWPGNGGVKDAPPIWSPYECVRRVMNENDVLELHEYWPVEGPGFAYRWLAGRFEQCPWKDVRIIIGECGLDAITGQDIKSVDFIDEYDAMQTYVEDVSVRRAAINVEKMGSGGAMISAAGLSHYGFHGLGSGNMDVAAQLYLDQLIWYNNKLGMDKRVLSDMPFTYDAAKDWATFNIRVAQFMNRMLSHISAVGGICTPEPLAPTPIPTPVPVTPTPTWGHESLAKWESLAVKYATARVSAKVIGAIIMLESRGNPNAISEKGAIGLMQVMPKEAGEQFKDRPTKAELFDPETNIKWGVNVLTGYMDYFSGSLTKGLAAYFGGLAGGTDLSRDISITYLTTFVKYWLQLWKEDLPFGNVIASDIDKVQAARWYAEEAVRSMESALKSVTVARSALVDNTIPRLYKLEGK